MRLLSPGAISVFMNVFKDDSDRRRRGGSKGASVYRVAGDPNDILVFIKFDTVEHAREHAEGLELHEAIKWATSNVSMPRFAAIDEVFEMEA